MAEPWIRVHANIAGKPVVWRAVEALEVSSHEAIGLLVQFWGAVSQHASNGELGEITNAQLEAWSGWRGRKGKFAAFVRATHLDADGRVNEWDDYAGKLELRRATERDRLRNKRLVVAQQRANIDAGVRSVLAPTRANDTKRDETLTTNSIGASDDAPGTKRKPHEYPPEFESLWADYPERAGKVDKPGALKAWSARRKAGISAAEMQAGAQRYKAFCEATGKVKTETVMQAKTFLGPNESWTETYDLPAAPSPVAGSIKTSPTLERAAALLAIAREYGLFIYDGNKAQYEEKMARAERDSRAGSSFRDEARAARVWQGINAIEVDRFKVDEIARRLDAAGVKVA